MSPLLTVVAALGSVGLELQAQNVPEVVWMTNAHVAPVTSVGFSGDGAKLASGSEDRTAKVWAVPEAFLVRAFETPSEWVLSVALAPDGALLAVGGDEGGIRVWRMDDGVRLWQNAPSENLIRTVAFSPNGTFLADATRGSDIVVHDPLTGFGVRFSGHDAEVISVAFSPDSTLLASASFDQTARLWRVVDRVVIGILAGHSNVVTSVDFSPDGVLLATAGADETARLWRVADGAQVRVIAGGGGVAKFSADGQLLLTVNGGPVSLWRVSNGQWLHTYTNAGASTLAVASDGKHFAYGRNDGVLVLARLPLWIIEATYQDYAVTLRWQGGSGRYQVQARMSLTSGAWQNLGGPTTNTTFSSICLSPMFYRVQSLAAP